MKKEKITGIILRLCCMILITAMIMESFPTAVLAAAGQKIEKVIEEAEEVLPENTPQITPDNKDQIPEDEKETSEKSEENKEKTGAQEEPKTQEKTVEIKQQEPANSTEAKISVDINMAKAEAEKLLVPHVTNNLTVAQNPTTQQGEVGQNITFSADVEADNPAAVAYQWQRKETSDSDQNPASTAEVVAEKKAQAETAAQAVVESGDMETLTKEITPEDIQANTELSQEEKEAAIKQLEEVKKAKNPKVIEPENEGWTDIPGANSQSLTLTVDQQNAANPVFYRMVARTPEAAIATASAAVRTEKDFASGDGSKDYPYLITNDAQLENLHKYEGRASSGKYFRLKPENGKSVMITDTSIGRINAPFMGTLDGDGYTITSYYSVDAETWQKKTRSVQIPAYRKDGTQVEITGAGLFGYTENAKIVNLNVKGAANAENHDVDDFPVFFFGTGWGDIASVIPGADFAPMAFGQIAAAGENTSIENCTTTGTCQVGNSYGDDLKPIQYWWWPFLIYKSNNHRELQAGLFVGSGTFKNQDYSVRFTGEIKNCFSDSRMKAYCSDYYNGYTFGGIESVNEGLIYPTSALSSEYQPALEGIYYRTRSDWGSGSQGTINPEAVLCNKIEEIDKINDYVAKGESGLNYWNCKTWIGGWWLQYEQITPQVMPRTPINFSVSDYRSTYDGTPKKVLINQSLKEARRGRDWDYSYYDAQGNVVDENSMIMPGTFSIRFKGLNRDFGNGIVNSNPEDKLDKSNNEINPNYARLIIDPVPDTTAPVYESIEWKNEDGSTYLPGTWTDQNVAITLKNLQDFTKGDNYNTTCGNTDYTVDKEGNEVSGINSIEIKDSTGMTYTPEPDKDNYTINLNVEEGQQLTATLTITLTDFKGNASVQTLDPVKISKSDVQIEVAAQKDNEETPTTLSGGIGQGYSFFAKNRARFEVKAAMADQSMYVTKIEYQFTGKDQPADNTAWQVNEFNDHQNPHSIAVSKNETFNGAIWIRATASNGKSNTLSYNLMIEAHKPTATLVPNGYQGKDPDSSGDSEKVGYQKDAIYHKVDITVNWKDSENEKSGIAKAEAYRADTGTLLGAETISNYGSGQGPSEGSSTFTCAESGEYAVKIIITDKSGNSGEFLTDILRIEAAQPNLEVAWSNPAKDEMHDFGKWTDQNATVTLSVTNNSDDEADNDLKQKVNYFYRRAKNKADIPNTAWEKINEYPLNVKDTQPYTTDADGDWTYEFKAVSQAAIGSQSIEKNIKVDTKELDKVEITAQDIKIDGSSSDKPDPNERGWYTEAEQKLQVTMRLANKGESLIKGYYETYYKASEKESGKGSKEPNLSGEFSTAVGAATQSQILEFDKEGIYTISAYSETDSRRGTPEKQYTFKIDRAAPVIVEPLLKIGSEEKNWEPIATQKIFQSMQTKAAALI